MKKAFTFLELIFVIVVIGILAVGGTDIFLRIYNTYFESRTQNEIQAKTQLALDKISNRLTYRIKPSVIISWGAGNSYSPLESATAATVPANTIYRLEWIAYDNDSLRGMASSANDAYIQPGWSGFIDLDASSGVHIATPGGNTTAVKTIVDSLSYGSVDLDVDAATNNAVIIFPDAPGSVNQYGWFNSGDTSLTHPVYRVDDNSFLPITGSDFKGVSNEVYENFQLAFSAYALEYDPASRNITLYYNYQPWNNETYSDGNKTLFLENVSNFIFTQVGSILKIQLCVNRSDADAVITGEQYALCKERAIF